MVWKGSSHRLCADALTVDFCFSSWHEQHTDCWLHPTGFVQTHWLLTSAFLVNMNNIMIVDFCFSSWHEQHTDCWLLLFWLTWTTHWLLTSAFLVDVNNIMIIDFCFSSWHEQSRDWWCRQVFIQPGVWAKYWGARGFHRSNDGLCGQRFVVFNAHLCVTVCVQLLLREF